MTAITADDGVRLDYTQQGPADGRPIVLLAGFKASTAMWLYQVPVLVDAGYRVISVDLRGHGAAERPASGVTMARRAEDVDAVLTALGLHDVTLVAQSMGGNTVWPYLQKYGTSRVSSVVIVDQTPRMLNSAEWPHGYYGFDETNSATFFAEGIPPTGKGTPVWRRGRRLLRLMKVIRTGPKEPETPKKDGRPQLTPGELELLADHAHADWRPVIAATTIPVLFIAGADSELWPSTHAAAAAALTTSARSAVIAHDGHAANVEQPAEFNRLLLDFLRSL
jgi:non-heme chloroperoxidase